VISVENTEPLGVTTPMPSGRPSANAIAAAASTSVKPRKLRMS
jgi:hypothetical protein